MSAILEMKELSDFPDYVEAVETLNRVRQEKNAVEREMEGVRQRASTKTKIEAEVDAVLAGKPLASVVTDDRIAETMNQLAHRRSVLHRAIEAQEKRVADIAAARGKEVAEEMLPAYREAVQRQLAAQLELADAAEAVTEFFREFQAKDIHYSAVIRPMQYGRLGKVTDENSTISNIVRELMTHAVLGDDELVDAGVPVAIISEYRRRIDNSLAEDAARRREEQKPARPVTKKWF